MFNVVGTKFGLGFKERRDLERLDLDLLSRLRINEKCGDVICILWEHEGVFYPWMHVNLL